MMVRRLSIACVASSLLVVTAPLPIAAAAPQGGAPFAVAASAGPQAGARVDAFVTRTVNGKRITLPGAVVPALEPGDEVVVRFPDYSPPQTPVRYHADVAFITEAAPQRWLYEKSGPWDRLFDVVRGRASAPATPRQLRFTYGSGRFRGIPIVFIVPEDAKTRGMDGVRDYVDAHPTDFKDMAESANDAVDRYAWFSDFLASLSQGSIDPVTGRERVEDVAVSLGADRSALDACYEDGGSQADIAACVQTTLSATTYQTNIEAPTQAQFFGGVAGAAAPLQVATYLIPLLSVWQIFARAGHQEYEYLPTTLNLVAPNHAGAPSGELLMGMKVPTLRPPAAHSDVLFFTIGDPKAEATPPVVVNASASGGVCARTDRLTVPLHLDRTSAFVHDTALVVTPDGKPSYSIPIDRRSVDAPMIPRARLRGSGDGAYSVALRGSFGFAPVEQPARDVARVALPASAAWSVATVPHHVAVTGGALDVIASSPSAPCLSGAELQVGNAAPIPLKTTALDDRRVELQASLANVPAGNATVRFYEDEPLRRTRAESTAALAIAPLPAHVDVAQSPVPALGDPFVALSGHGFERVTALNVDGMRYAKDAGSTSTEACFSGPPLGRALAAGTTVSAQLIGSDGSPGEVFDVTVAPPRPVVRISAPASNAAASSNSTESTVHLSTQILGVALDAANGAIPAQRELRLRRALPQSDPCDAVRDEGTFAVVPAGDTHADTAARLSADVDAAQELGDAAFGTLQLQLVDVRMKLASAWTPIPGTFVRAPAVNRIECPADPAAPCTLVGTGLASIAGVETAPGTFVAPSFDCTPDVKGMACRAVPHETHYMLRLEDAETIESLPDALVRGGAAPSATPARRSSPKVSGA